MKKSDIIKELDKLGVAYKSSDLKSKLERRLKRAQRKLGVEKEVEIKVETEKPKAPERSTKKEILRAVGSEKEIWKVEDIETGQGPMKKVFFHGFIEVWTPEDFEKNTYKTFE